MKDIGQFLVENYMSKFPKYHIDYADLVTGLTYLMNRTIVIVEDDEIQAVGIYLMLDDDTYNNIDSIDIRDVDIMKELLLQQGDNYHFILLCSLEGKNILKGIEEVKKRKAKTISWYNPEMTKLNKFKLRS